jgi:hypothetical protein
MESPACRIDSGSAISPIAEDTKAPVEVSRDFIHSHCLDCHNDRKQKGEINLKPLLQDQNTGPGIDLFGYRFENQAKVCVRVFGFSRVEFLA